MKPKRKRAKKQLSMKAIHKLAWKNADRDLENYREGRWIRANAVECVEELIALCGFYRASAVLCQGLRAYDEEQRYGRTLKSPL